MPSFFRRLIIICGFSLIQLWPDNSVFAETVEISDFGNNPGKLKMVVYKPSSKPENGLHPLVVALHGCSQSASQLEKLSGWNKIADQTGSVILYPEQQFTNNSGYCFNWFSPGDYKSGKGENESIMQMINYLKLNWPVDTTRIFLYGVSAGAVMAQALAVTHPDVFSAAALFAGTAYGLVNSVSGSLEIFTGKLKVNHNELIAVAKNDLGRNQGVLPKIFIYQGLDDKVVPPENAYYLRDQWLGLHNAEASPGLAESFYKGNPDITKTVYFNPQNEEVVTTYIIANLNHRLMISPGNEPHQGGESGWFGMKSNFHSTYEVALNFQLLKK